MTHDQLDAEVQKCRVIGGVYDLLGALLEDRERPRCTE